MSKKNKTIITKTTIKPIVENINTLNNYGFTDKQIESISIDIQYIHNTYKRFVYEKYYNIIVDVLKDMNIPFITDYNPNTTHNKKRVFYKDDLIISRTEKINRLKSIMDKTNQTIKEVKTDVKTLKTKEKDKTFSSKSNLDLVIEKNIKYYLKTDIIIDSELLVKNCRYISKSNFVMDVSIIDINMFFRYNPYYKELIKNHNDMIDNQKK